MWSDVFSATANKTIHRICTRALTTRTGRTGLLPVILSPAGYTVKHRLLPIAYIQTPQLSKEQRSVKEEEAVGPKQGLVVSSCGGWAVKATTSCAQKKAHPLIRTSAIVGSLSHRCPDILKRSEEQKSDWRQEEHLIDSHPSSHRFQLPPFFCRNSPT